MSEPSRTGTDLPATVGSGPAADPDPCPEGEGDPDPPGEGGDWPVRSRRRKVSNPLALAVLGCLSERPMHPYEMATTMRLQHQDDSIKLNYGSLYTVVDALGRHGLIEAQETERAGRRPERTVYRITDAGSRELVEWLSELLSVPSKEYLRFEAGLSLLPALRPEEVTRLLSLRCHRLRAELVVRRAQLEQIATRGVPRLLVVEHEYMTALMEAELAWTSSLLDEVVSGSLEGMEMWRSFHRATAGSGGDARSPGAPAHGGAAGAAPGGDSPTSDRSSTAAAAVATDAPPAGQPAPAATHTRTTGDPS